MRPKIHLVTFEEVRRLRPSVRLAEVDLWMTEEALGDVCGSIGVDVPETGGIGLGHWERAGADVFEFDERGSSLASGVAYAPDTTWCDVRLAHWQAQAGDEMRLLTFGCHSHPPGLGFPSQAVGPGLGDLGYAAAVLENLEWMMDFHIPIITEAGTRFVRLWSWVVSRSHPHEARFAPVHIVPADAFPRRRFNPEFEDAPSIRTTPQAEPRCTEAPSSTATPRARNDMARHTQEAEGRSRKSASTHPHPRLSDIVSASLAGKRVLVAGGGAGSHGILQLARLGVDLTIIDRDVVETANLVRTAYRARDVGRPKAEALVELIRETKPDAVVRGIHRDILEIPDGEIASLMEGIDLNFAGTDNFAAQARIDEWSVAYRTPLVSVGVHEKARGGAVTWSIPGETACYRCIERVRYETAADGDASAVDLPGATGSAIDIGFIDSVALKLIVGLLERDEDSEYGRFFRALGARNQVIVRTHPAFRFDEDLDPFDVVLDDLPTSPKPFKDELKDVFFACDTLWLSVERDPKCANCGHLWPAPEKRDA